MSDLGVVIVTYKAQDVIRDCLESLIGSGTEMRVVVVDNASPDNTVTTIRNWINGADGYTPPTMPFAIQSLQKPVTNVTLLEARRNNGFAAGVNIGLTYLLKDPDIEKFWILNPDTLIPPDTPHTILNCSPPAALMGGRVLYSDPPHKIQIDAGTLNRWTGVTGNLGLGQPGTAPQPDMGRAAFISGAHMIASRAFIERAGLMPEDYFLYYEEVDWALRRGPAPLSFCKDAIVYHRAGTSIGSPSLTSRASAFSVYHKHRSRLMFLRKHRPYALPMGVAYSIAKLAQFVITGQIHQALALAKATLSLGRARSLQVKSCGATKSPTPAGN